MAQSVNDLRSKILTSIYGRRLGMDANEFLVGQKDIKKAVLDLTTGSTATALNNYGQVNIVASSLGTSAAGAAFLLSNPEAGVDVSICNVNANSSAASPGSTALTLLRPSTAFVILSSEGSTMTTINLTPGSNIVLHGLSSALYQVKSRTTLAGTVINGTT